MADALALILIVFCSWDWYRLFSRPQFADAFSKLQKKAAMGGILWVSMIACLVYYHPVGLRLLSGLLVSVAVYRRWRDRAATGYPPGPRGLLTTFRSLIDQDFYQDSRTKFGEIFKTSQFHHDVICLVSFERFHELLTAHEERLEACPLPFHRSLAAGFLRYMRPEQYQVYGPLFRRALSRETQSRAGDSLKSILPNQLREVAERGADFQQVMADAVFQGFLSSLFGLESTCPLYAEFLPLYRSFEKQSYGDRPNPKTLESLRRLCRFLERSELYDNGSHALSQFRLLDSRMPDRACLENLLYIVRMSVGNVVGLLQWLIAVLAENPVWLERVRERSSGTEVADRILKETLRLHQSEYLYRRVRETFSYGGFEFPAGWLIRVCVRECHRDPVHFPNPKEFDPDRFLTTAPTKKYAPFGVLNHACNGIGINRSICLAFLETLAGGYQLELVESKSPYRDLRHWSHWRPRSKVRIKPLSSDSPGTEIELR